MAATADPLESFYFEHEEQQRICGQPVSPITDGFDPNYPSVVDRFFTRYYYIRANAAYQVLYHSNRICLICLAPTHPALAQGIATLSFDVGNVDRSQNVVKGKGKKGGMILQADSTLALLTTETGQTYKIPSCIRGKLVEVNAALVAEPKLLEQLPEGAGYFAILLPKIENCDLIKEKLLTQEQYEEYLKTSQEQDTEHLETSKEQKEEENMKANKEQLTT
ncbi:protein Abitram [Drosophila guanche]|uniref:Protein Abitram n=1 Tax=Drosophila guanche TaxID=7266 RepID=A0A3B0KB58_DROGU|nr:protein Abitram [Drosophila guanche]SPP80808.1 blast:Juxtaposed with another zinc finger protein 1 [Drosophila guanche]